ncbi:MAG: hypothetical protein ACP5JG_19265, partial [Anaerolineae bacterium]
MSRGGHASSQNSRRLLTHHTGVVIPVYLPEGIPVAQGEALLRDTVAGYVAQVSEPARVCLSVDGEAHGETVARQLQREFGTSVTVATVNKGKLQGARQGVSHLLEDRALHFMAIVDQDGDHFANELLNFVRAAAHIADQTGDDRLVVLGRRISPHRPMGWLRGELELLADQVMLNALRYHAAIKGNPLRLEYATMLDAVPDFHSGYKLFSRSTAASVFLTEPALAGLPDIAYYRHACEAVMVVEALLSGARLGVVNRTTFNEQPVSTFGLFDRAQLTADMILWPCRRLGVPAVFVRQWLA